MEFQHNRPLAIVLGLIFLGVFLHNLAASAICTAQTLCVDSYWARTWGMSYFDGYTKRALVGTALEVATADHGSFLIVNAIGLAVIGLIGLLSIGLLSRMFAQDRLIPVAAFLAGPTIMVLVETMGDNMQVALLLLITICLLAGRLQPVLLVAFLPVSAAIHEASIFLLWPTALAFLSWTILGRVRVPAIALVMLLGLVAIALVPEGDTAARATTLAGTDGTPLLLKARPPLSLSRALELEALYHFGSVTSTLKFFYQTISFAAWPLIFLAVLARLRTETALITNFLVLLALSSPLFMIAHDWSRFAVILLIASLFLRAGGGRYPGRCEPRERNKAPPECGLGADSEAVPLHLSAPLYRT